MEVTRSGAVLCSQDVLCRSVLLQGEAPAKSVHCSWSELSLN